MLIYRNRRFLFNADNDMYELLHCPSHVLGETLAARASGVGLTDADIHENATVYGKNVMAVPVPTVIDLIIKECLHPFFIFQVYSVTLWCFEQYYVFAVVIAIMAIASVASNIYDTRKNITRLQNLARSEVPVDVIRNGQEIEISSTALTVGDLVVLSNNLDIPCDLTLLTGSVVINEAMLTGESVPVVKYPVLDASTSATASIEVGKDTRSTLFAGTRVMQLKPQTGSTRVLALVVRTGFFTTKGNMISSMLYPPKSTFRFEKQSYKFLGFLFLLSFIGMGFTFWRYSLEGVGVDLMIKRGLDLVTIVVPPSLPLAMSIGVSFSIRCLSKLKIFCIDPGRITFAGKVKMMCFDKTGTLTADSLKFRGIHSFVPLNYTTPVTVEGEVSVAHQAKDKSAFTFDKHLLSTNVRACLATCHSLAMHEGSFVGDPLEIEGFVAASSRFQEASVKGVLFHTQLKRHAFKPKAQNFSLAEEEASDEPANEENDNAEFKADEDVTSRIPDHSVVVSGDQNLLVDMVYDDDENNCQCDCHFYDPNTTKDDEIIRCTCSCSSTPTTVPISEATPTKVTPFSVCMSSLSVAGNSKSARLGRGGVRRDVFANGKTVRGCNDEGRYWSTVKQFPFESALQRMAVLAINELDLTVHAFAKGAPEMIASLCNPATVPANFQHVVDWYTHQGHRVIALAGKPVTVSEIACKSPAEEEKDSSEQSLSGVVDNLSRAMATRDFTDLRAQVESNLTLFGLLVLENALKPATKPTIAKLRMAQIRTVMVTGDNIRTAVSVSKECGIIPVNCACFVSRVNKREGSEVTVRDITWHHSDIPDITLDPESFVVQLPENMSRAELDFDKYELAVSGDAFAVFVKDHEARLSQHARMYPAAREAGLVTHSRSSGMVDPTATSAAAAVFEFPNMADISLSTPLQRICLYGAVFARFTPDQKAGLVNTLNKLGMYTGMCGDGANDCGALKTAHVGVSLAESEASIAAPFTSQISDISCIPIVLCEGRSALATAFLLFRFMSIYSFIQFFSVTLLYYDGGAYCDWQFLYQDLFAVFPLAIVMGNTPSGKHLTKKRPSGNLLSFKNMLSINLHMLTAGLGQFLIFYLTQFQKGYHVLPNEDHYCEMWEAPSLHYFVCMQYVLYCIICSISPPWKRRITTNIPLTITLILSFAFTMFCLFTSPSKSPYFPFTYSDVWIPTTWRINLIFMFGAQIVVACLIEYAVVPCFVSINKSRMATHRTNTAFGKGNDQLEKGAKPYHLLRRDFENAWPQKNAVNIVIDRNSSREQRSVNPGVYARMQDQPHIAL